jgi:hypothetical protein
MSANKELAMDYVIDLGSELLVDRSRLPMGQLRLLLAAIGHPLVTGSPWMVVDKRAATTYRPLLAALRQTRRQVPAA